MWNTQFRDDILWYYFRSLLLFILLLLIYLRYGFNPITILKMLHRRILYDTFFFVFASLDKTVRYVYLYVSRLTYHHSPLFVYRPD